MDRLTTGPNMAKDPQLTKARETVIDNLEAIKNSLVRCVEDGMIDTDDYFYNEILGLLADASILRSWDELLEAVTKAKTLEIDIAAFLARKGRATLALPWPKKS